MTLRAVIFTDIAGATPRLLIEATISEAQRRPDLKIVGFVTANPDEILVGRRQRLTAMAKALVVRATGGRARIRPGLNLARIASRLGVPLIATHGNVNHADFIARLHRELEPDLLLSYFFTKILRERLLDSFSQAVNYHDGLLPSYGGLDATSHSVYRGEPESGFTFHRITPSIDGGPVLCQGAVPVTSDMGTGQVSVAKTAAAALALPSVLDQIAELDPGRPQTGDGSYFSQSDHTNMTTIDEPAGLSSSEIKLRLRAFGSLHITIAGQVETVTQLKTARPGSPFRFVSSDGVSLRASRVARLPARMIWARRRVRRHQRERA